MTQVQFIDQNGQKVVGGKELIAEAQKNPKTKYWVDMEIGDKQKTSLFYHLLVVIY